jgi:hypothetical protein
MVMSNDACTLKVKCDEATGEYFIEFNEEFMKQAGFSVGDTVEWIDQGGGSWIIKKKVDDTEFVLVETVQMFRHRYVVEVPVGKSEWALDTVTMQQAGEFSQEHLGETITSHRVVSRDEILSLCDRDNDYAKSWTDEHKFETFVTRVSDYS